VIFHAWTRYSIISERGIKANAALGIKYRKTRTRRRYLAEQLMEAFVREQPDDEEDEQEDEQDEGDDDNEEDDDDGYSE